MIPPAVVTQGISQTAQISFKFFTVGQANLKALNRPCQPAWSAARQPLGKRRSCCAGTIIRITHYGETAVPASCPCLTILVESPRSYQTSHCVVAGGDHSCSFPRFCMCSITSHVPRSTYETNNLEPKPTHCKCELKRSAFGYPSAVGSISSAKKIHLALWPASGTCRPDLVSFPHSLRKGCLEDLHPTVLGTPLGTPKTAPRPTQASPGNKHTRTNDKCTKDKHSLLRRRFPRPAIVFHTCSPTPRTETRPESHGESRNGRRLNKCALCQHLNRSRASMLD